MDLVFPPASRVILPITGSKAAFPVRRVYCVGQNYALHVAEMGGNAKEEPFFFSKPADALVPEGGNIAYPPLTANLQHEVELVVALGMGGANIPAEKALAHVFGYAVGIDLTRRDLQAQAKAKGRPWDMSKGFDQSAPVSALKPVFNEPHPTEGRIWLKVNGEVRQDGNLAQMSWHIDEIIAKLSMYVALAAGDLIFTGTPAGVSTINRGDEMECGIDGIGILEAKLF